METNQELQEWRESAPFWNKHANTIREMFAPVTRALIQEARISEGQVVLDVAGGAGEPSLTIAEVVGPGGSVIFTDPIPGMVAAAESEGHKRGLTNITFRQSTADSLPFAVNSFDVVVCRLGIMFFPDPALALREMLRVTKPCGGISLVVWGRREANPFTSVGNDIVARHVPAVPASAATHDAFGFAERGKLAALLEHAGAASVRERMLEFQIVAPLSPEEFWQVRSETSATIRDRLRMLTREQRQSVTEEVRAALLPFFPNNQMRLPAEMVIVSGEKPDQAAGSL